MKHPRPQLNTADPAQLDAASDLLDEGEAPDLGILIAARQERLRGGLSRYTVQGLVTLGRLSDQKRETHRLVLIADWARDNDPNGRGRCVTFGFARPNRPRHARVPAGAGEAGLGGLGCVGMAWPTRGRLVVDGGRVHPRCVEAIRRRRVRNRSRRTGRRSGGIR